MSVLTYKCQNCQWDGPQEACKPAKDVHMRHVPGDVFSDLECPECGALCFPVHVAEDETAEQYVIVVGNPVDGLSFIGPYTERKDAEDECESIQQDWWIAPMELPS